MLKKIISIVLLVSMVISFNTVSFAGEVEGSNKNKIKKAKIEKLYLGKAQNKNITESKKEKNEFFDILDQLQALELSKNSAELDVKEREKIEKEIEKLEKKIEKMDSVIPLNNEEVKDLIGKESEEEMMTTMGLKPSVPSGSTYVGFYGLTSYVSYGGDDYEVFEIVAYSKKTGGFGNPMGYTGTKTLLTDNAYSENQFLQTIETAGKFAASYYSLAFAVTDVIALSQMPSFFDTGSTQELTVDYDAQQIFVFAYVADSGVDWYEHSQTSERLRVASTYIASYTGSGVTEHKSGSMNHTVDSDYYSDVNNAAKVYHDNLYPKVYYVGDYYYYHNGVKKATINTNSYSQLGSVPGS